MDGFRLDLGASWLALVSTVSGRFREQQTDALATVAELRDFLTAVGLAPRRAPDADDHAAAIELREALYGIARAGVDGTPVPRSAVRVLNAALTHDVPPALTGGADGLVAARPTDTRQALARIARQAVEDTVGADQVRLRPCGDDTCATIFVDASGRRRFCDDGKCGTRMRVQAHRARARAAKSTDPGGVEAR